MNEKIFEDILSYHYGETRHSLAQIAERHGVEVTFCENRLLEIKAVTQPFRNIPEREPSIMVLNKIKAYACEYLQERANASIWRPWIRFAAVFASFVVLVFGLSRMAGLHKQSENKIAKGPTSEMLVDPVKERLFTHFFANGNLPKGNLPLAPVSIGNGEYSFGDDSELEQKMFTKSLSGHDVETLYFRARRLEKQGYFQEALQDYSFLARNYPDFAYGRYLPLNAALCHEMLGDKEKAIEILNTYQETYGEDKDVTLWIDQLKSVSF